MPGSARLQPLTAQSEHAARRVYTEREQRLREDIPPASMISFWYGNRYVGVTRGHPSDIEAARARLMRTVHEQAAPHTLAREVYELGRAGAQLTWLMVRKDLTFFR